MNSIERFINKLNKNSITLKADHSQRSSKGSRMKATLGLSCISSSADNDTSIRNNSVCNKKINDKIKDKSVTKPFNRAQESTRQDKYNTKINAEIDTRVTIDLERLKIRGMLTPENTQSKISEEFRVIKRPLLKNAFGLGNAPQMANVIMVTSAIAGEGKSFTAINLAMSLVTELDYTVLLVDADVIRSSLNHYLGIETSGGGFIDLISSQNHFSVSHLLVKTNLANLTYLPAGTYQPNATELLSSHNAYQFLQELSQRYPNRLVILDSPPLLETSEARVLASLVGQLVLVVESDKTPQGVVLEALAQLGTDLSVGIVLNKIKGKLTRYGYYGNYGE